MKARLAILPLSLLAALGFVIAGCVALDPTADPFVVRTEQAQTVAKSTFDLVLNQDHADRGFWRTNAPAFHSFCEWLRTPTPYQGTNFARCVVMQLNVDDAKLAYRASRIAANSNALYGVLALLTQAQAQAGSWQFIVTNRIHPSP